MSLLLQKQANLFISQQDADIEGFLNTLINADVSVIGPELVFGKLFDHIGFNVIPETLFRHLVIARLAFPLSKLKTVDYLYRFRGICLSVSSVYRFLDKLNNTLKEQGEQIAFKHTSRLHHNSISIVFYNMTTLYFETSDEDDLRKTGFSKDGKHQSPQIYLGLLVTIGGDAIGYDIFESTIYEGHTAVPFIERISNEFKNDHTRLIIAYSDKRAAKDAHNRKRGLQRLEKQIQSGRLNKSNINNKGYNKYLKMQGDVVISIDYEKFEADRNRDGIKGYITNTKLSAGRIEAHICISFTAYKILKELERLLKKEKALFSVTKAAELTHNMYQITAAMPDTKKKQAILLKMTAEQTELSKIIAKDC